MSINHNKLTDELLVQELQALMKRVNYNQAMIILRDPKGGIVVGREGLNRKDARESLAVATYFNEEGGVKSLD